MTSPTYEPKIPKSSNSIAQGQPDFLNNFQILSNAFSSDHIPLDAASNAGNHTVARLTEQSSGTATGTSEVALYAKNVTLQSDQLFYRGLGNGQEIQYSNYQILPLEPIKNGNTVVETPYYTFLPGGIIMYFGSVFQNSNPFSIFLNPAICKNIIGINLGLSTPNNSALYPSAPTPIPNQEGKYATILLQPAVVGVNMFYIVYGVI